MISWLVSNAFVLAVGYAICVLFPLPGVNAWIISKYATVWTWVKSKVLGTVAPPAPPAA
jgi:hypothetical protein